mgnify:CR=1 FL=1
MSKLSALDAGVEMTTLPCGIRIVTHAMPHLQSATLGVWVGSGTRNEAADQNGISHLLEHMAFKGTMTRSARQIAEEIESVGGEINAATGHEATAYFARVLRPDVGLGLELIADMLRNPRFEDAELDLEREVILQEIAASRDQPEEVVCEQADEVAYPGQAVGRPILGDPANIRSLDADDLRRHMAVHYTCGNLVVSAAGAVDHARLVRHAEALFAGFNPATAPAAEAASFRGGTRVQARRFEQTHLLLGYESPSIRDPRYIGVQILAAVLGGGASSRLFQKVREERGLCYAIDASASGYMDTGLLAIQAATSRKLLEELMQVTGLELVSIMDEGPSMAEVERAKAQLKAGLLMSLESSGARAEQLARQTLVHGRPLGLADLAAKVDSVTVSSVRELARSLLSAERHVWSEVGPKADGKAGERLAARLQHVLH